MRWESDRGTISDRTAREAGVPAQEDEILVQMKNGLLSDCKNKNKSFNISHEIPHSTSQYKRNVKSAENFNVNSAQLEAIVRKQN